MDEHQGVLLAYTCPACKGVLRKGIDNSYRCPVGHLYTPRALIAKQTEEIEAVLWTAIRILEEQAKVLTDLTKEPQTADKPEDTLWLEHSTTQPLAYADALRRLLVTYPLPH